MSGVGDWVEGFLFPAGRPGNAGKVDKAGRAESEETTALVQRTGMGREEMYELFLAMVAKLEERKAVEGVQVMEPELSEDELNRLLPPAEEVPLKESPPLQLRLPRQYRAALKVVASDRKVSVNRLAGEYIRTALAAHLARMRERDGSLPEDDILG
jgi:predicted HicB family RNase H-like nuclease